MVRLLSILLALTFIAAPAFAADDGGFGTERFYDEAPAALGDPDQGFDPQSVEPAAGVEADADGQVNEGDADAAIQPSEDEAPAVEPASGTVIDMVPSAE